MIVGLSLAWLLQPVTVQTFLDEIWGVAPYHVKRRCAGYFDGLLRSPSAAEELLGNVQSDPSTMRLVRGQEKKDGDTYRRADGSLDLVRVRTDFAAGYTIVLDRVEQYVRAIALLSHAIEVELNFPTQVNAYVTPPDSQGFLPHYDQHDVLVLQIQGSKIWHLYGDVVAPHVVRRYDKVVTANLPAPTDLLLEAGDVLYLPRGQVHSAETSSEPSVHLTLGIRAPTVLTLVTHMLYLLSVRDDRVHTRLPPRHLEDADARASLDVLVHGMAKMLEDPNVIAEGCGAMAEILARRGRCPPVGQISNAAGIDERTLVVKYQPLFSRVVALPGGVALQFAQLSITASPDHHAAMLFVSSATKPFRIGDLPGLSAKQQTELARKLIASGFLIRLPDD
ncbi:cupin [Mycobacterium sp. SM1]|uniref:cupin domain-containing protein n=1 Tax=Mycobacterium sp. SM1 TaxID=2816243 RepID=UPI001BCF142C|nr:cupin domain-containing protein [Mycobacterium sp. SM1]MBS4728308.1 cupin [Mycobacterium sp. SM1]